MVKGSDYPSLRYQTFDGDVLHWAQFSEQFKISIHDRPQLSDSEKLVYLQQAVKNGSAKSVIEGLSRFGENYRQAIDCLKSRSTTSTLCSCAQDSGSSITEGWQR